ncbi:MAG: sulfatase-like hydrolase/transferase [Thermoplasmata archaeon]
MAVTTDVTPGPGARPNFLIIVLDAARWADFPGVGHPGGVPMPFTQELESHSIVFPKSVAPAPWTIPSHASLFTGLYPWEHGVNRRGTSDLPGNVSTLSERLSAAGYRTLSASSNGFVSPNFGMTRGFGSVAWGDWWEKMIHVPGQTLPSHGIAVGRTLRAPEGRWWRMAGQATTSLMRYPWTLNLANHVASHLRAPGARFHYVSAPWVEPTVRRWVMDQPADAPVFCFINFHDTHEPYYPSRGPTESLGSFLGRTRQRTDQAGFLAGHWTPNPKEIAALHSMYQETFRTLDRRVAEVVSSFREAGRWENTVLVLTSDHGQEFLEKGFLFHSLGVSEQLLRIPLVLRLPGDRRGGQVATGWASLIDVAPTFLEMAHLPSAFPSGRSLMRLVSAERSEPVLAMGDGFDYSSGAARACSPERRRFWDHAFAVGYDGDSKVVLDLERRRISSFHLRMLGTDGEVPLADSDPSTAALVQEVKRLAERIPTRSGTPPSEATVDDRLSSWGY